MMQTLAKSGGYTLVEVMTAIMITTLIAAGAMSIMVSSLTCFDNTTVKTSTDSDAVIAMQRIVNDVREATSFSLPSSNCLRLIFPERKIWSGTLYYYDRNNEDPASQIDYYLSDSTGDSGRTGTYLWRSDVSGNRQLIKRDIVAISYEQDDEQSIRITLTAENSSYSGPVDRRRKTTNLTQRVIYLRNY